MESYGENTFTINVGKSLKLAQLKKLLTYVNCQFYWKTNTVRQLSEVMLDIYSKSRYLSAVYSITGKGGFRDNPDPQQFKGTFIPVIVDKLLVSRNQEIEK